jgi:hypothetical protein
MRRRLASLAVVLSTVLSAASLFMWVRSLSVTEAWDFEPVARPSWITPTDSGGWYRFRIVESTGGRLVFVQYDAVIRPPVAYVGAPWWQVPPPQVYGYNFGRPFAPGQYSRAIPQSVGISPDTFHGRIPGVAEWYLIPTSGRQRHVAVSWLALAGAGAVVPCLRAWRRWQRSHPRAGFAVVWRTPVGVMAPAGERSVVQTG